ncbi:MAG: DUF2382 domain-containing protein [Gaiellaceae bacterium]
MTEGSTVLDWRGHTMVDKDGDNIGKIQEIYLDERTEKPEWALVHTGLFGSKSSFVPLAAALISNGGICVPYEKGHVKDAPKIDADQALTQDEEAALYRHYGLEYGESRSGSGLPEGDPSSNGVGHDTSGPDTDEAMTRSEEELAVGKAQRERGRVRLKKYVVTEEVQQTVPVQREEVRVEREPITEANVDQATDGPAISDEEHEVTLMEEQVVTEKRAVPKERVRLGKETVTDEQQVSDEIRKERIEVDGDGDGGSR